MLLIAIIIIKDVMEDIHFWSVNLLTKNSFFLKNVKKIKMWMENAKN